MEVADGRVLCLLSYIGTSLLAVFPLSGIFWRRWLVQHDKNGLYQVHFFGRDGCRLWAIRGQDYRCEREALRNAPARVPGLMFSRGVSSTECGLNCRLPPNWHEPVLRAFFLDMTDRGKRKMEALNY